MNLRLLKLIIGVVCFGGLLIAWKWLVILVNNLSVDALNGLAFWVSLYSVTGWILWGVVSYLLYRGCLKLLIPRFAQ